MTAPGVRTGIYNYPERRVRTVEWIGRLRVASSCVGGASEPESPPLLRAEFILS